MCARIIKEKGQVILETVLVIICLSVIAIASVRLFANLNTSMLNRLDIYRSSRKAALNDPDALSGREIDVAPRSASVKRAISDPTAFLDYTGGVGGIIPDIPKGDFGWNYGLMYEKDLIFNFVLRYKFNQIFWFAHNLHWNQTTPTRGYFYPPQYIKTMKNSLKELYDKDTGYDPIFRSQEGLIARGYNKMIEQLALKYKTYDVVNGIKVHNASKQEMLNNATERLINVTRGTNDFLNRSIAANLGKIYPHTTCCPRVYYRERDPLHDAAVANLTYIVFGYTATINNTGTPYYLNIFGPVPEGADMDSISPFLTRAAGRTLYYTRSYLSRPPTKENIGWSSLGPRGRGAIYWAERAQENLTINDALANEVLTEMIGNLYQARAYRLKIDSRLYPKTIINDTKALEYYYNISQLQSWALYEVVENIRY